MTGYVILKLSTMISDYGEELLNRMFADYESVYKSSVDDFLSKKSITMEKKGECRTHIAINPDDMKIIGSFSLDVRCLEIPDDCGLSKNLLKKMNRSEDNITQAYPLGQNEHAKIGQVSDKFGITVPAVSKIISKLKSNGYLANEGNNRLNKWRRL